MKRSIAAATAAVLLAVGLSACGGGGSETSSSSSFCDRARGVADTITNVDFSNPDEFKRLAADAQQMAQDAPSEIKSDAQTLADAAAKYSGDITALLDPATRQPFVGALENVQRYIETECGIDINTGS
jgi:ABC-type glycerol-3-phosphate transport system substrate-binding protein